MQSIHHPTLATRFGHRTTRVLRSADPLDETQMRTVAPSIFAAAAHASRSERYTYIPTIDVLRSLRQEGFEPFMVAQGRSRVEGKSEFTKHMIRMRHHRDIGAPALARSEVNEIILINSHDGASSYQLLAGMFRFVCCNGLVIGDVIQDVRIPHKGNIQGEVIEGAVRVLNDFEVANEHAEAMKALPLQREEELVLARAALALRFGERTDAITGEPVAAPITAEQLIEARRPSDQGNSLWTAFQRIQENVLRGGQAGRSARGQRVMTRPVGSIDRSVALNRALWMLAEGMRELKA